MPYKVVIFCGGQGTRIKELSEKLPKPLITVEGTPIVFHIMKHYAKFGIKDFILCLGYKKELFYEYFLRRKSMGDGSLSIINGEIVKDNDITEDWNISMIDTGLDSCIGERLLKVKKHKLRRGYDWTTITEPLNAADKIAKLNDKQIMLFDCATMWLTNHFLEENDIHHEIKLLIKKKVTPKQGRVIVFNGSYWHTAEQPKDNNRCVINTNITYEGINANV